MKLLFHDAGMESISILENYGLFVAKKENNIQPMVIAHSSTAHLIGQTLRRLRLQAGLTQNNIARELGVSFQQVQKYETGRNALPMEKLLILKTFYNVPFDVFFEGIVTTDQSLNVDINRCGGRGKIPTRNGGALKNPDRMCAPKRLPRSCQMT
jgi:transcriptional regulator with XRE-family HTH domain